MSSWNYWLVGSQQEVVQANEQIDTNCNFPSSGTETWDRPTQAYQQEFWFIRMPPPQGYKTEWGSFTQQQMMQSVVNVTQQESQSNWWPPVPNPPQKKEKKKNKFLKMLGV